MLAIFNMFCLAERSAQFSEIWFDLAALVPSS